MNGAPKDSSADFEAALDAAKDAKYVLRLYVAGNTPASSRAITSIRDTCEQYLKGRYQLEVIDIYQQQSAARGDQIIATPTLIKTLPLPLRKMIGDLSRQERLLVGLDLVPFENPK